MALEETNNTSTNEAEPRGAIVNPGTGGTINPDIGLLTNKTIFDRFSLKYNNTKQQMAEVAAVSGEMAASLEGIYYNFTTPKDTFVRSPYFQVDPALNKEETVFIKPTTSYGGWGNEELYEVYDLNTKFACAGNLRYVKPEACPHLRLTTTTTDADYLSSATLTPFEEEYTIPDDIYRIYKCYWDNKYKRIIGQKFESTGYFNTSGMDHQVHNSLSEDYSSTSTTTIMKDTYGCFILLAGAGGGGGGADNEYWGQGKPGGSGGGGGATALVYVDLYQLYLDYGEKSCVYIKCGHGGSGGAGGASRADGTDGGATILYVCSDFTKATAEVSILATVTVSGGAKGLTHYWDVAADSAGGGGGSVSAHSTLSNATNYVKVLTECPGGTGAVGKRGAMSTTGSTVTSKYYNLPFKNSYYTIKWMTYNYYTWTIPSGETSTAYIGVGAPNNNHGGGGGGCALGLSHNGTFNWYGWGGTGGHNGGAGTAGGPGGYIILTSYNFNKLIDVSE